MGNRRWWAGGKKVKGGGCTQGGGRVYIRRYPGKVYIKNWWVYSTQGDTEVYVRRHYCGPKEEVE